MSGVGVGSGPVQALNTLTPIRMARLILMISLLHPCHGAREVVRRDMPNDTLLRWMDARSEIPKRCALPGMGLYLSNVVYPGAMDRRAPTTFMPSCLLGGT